MYLADHVRHSEMGVIRRAIGRASWGDGRGSGIVLVSISVKAEIECSGLCRVGAARYLLLWPTTEWTVCEVHRGRARVCTNVHHTQAAVYRCDRGTSACTWTSAHVHGLIHRQGHGEEVGTTVRRTGIVARTSVRQGKIEGQRRPSHPDQALVYSGHPCERIR
jgi:hypothetical protein